VSHLLQEKNGELGNYLTSDPKGKLIPQFFIEVAGELEAEQKKALTELEQLTKNIDHIKDIVAMQQSYARKSGVMEKVTLQSLVEDALQMSSGALTRHEIKIIRQFADVPAFMMDKHKVLQILINLIRNGRHALEASGQVEKRITITVAKDGDNAVMVRVEDNGVGIPEENLIRIFSHGFTTKPDGHGFGLHIGALNAKEMGGSLNAASEGVGRGAAFTLLLPFSAAS
jgi:C4-dicarboxylate-specific signal transduction histidine kinase